MGIEVLMVGYPTPLGSQRGPSHRIPHSKKARIDAPHCPLSPQDPSRYVCMYSCTLRVSTLPKVHFSLFCFKLAHMMVLPLPSLIWSVFDALVGKCDSIAVVPGRRQDCDRAARLRAERLVFVCT